MSTSPKGLNCPNCGAALTIRAMEHTLTVVCVQCLSVLDAKDPNLKILQTFAERERIRPLIPLGSRGKFHGDAYEAVGFQVRTIYVEGDSFSWSEYLLFNPYKGFRYLTEYNGHWNEVKTVKAVPELARAGSKLAVRLLGETYTHFQTATAETSYVMGEFPWQARVGDRVEVKDFIAPPRILSAETTEGETVWSLGEYTSGSRVWEMFQLPGSPPPAVGIFANQPSPYKGQVAGIWKTFMALLAATLLVALLISVLSGRQELFRRQYSFSPRGGSAASFTTPPFEMKGRASNVEIGIRSDVDWAYFNFALINPGTGETRTFAREVDYSRRERDVSWTEAGPGDTVVIPTVPPGRYYLLVEPELQGNVVSMNYELRVRRDVPVLSFPLIAAGLLLIPPVFLSLRAVGFEQSRWQESDYGGSESESSSEEDDEDDEE